jgi:hypothetical protein
MPSLTITWKALIGHPTPPCPICKDLHGHQWVFNVTGEPIPDSLTHPQYGVVWNTTIGSQAHGHQVYNCRCSIIPNVDVSDLKAKIQLMLNMTEEGAQFEVFTRYGQPVGAWRDVSTGQFVSQQ